MIKNNTRLCFFFWVDSFFYIYTLKQFKAHGGLQGEGEVKVGGDETWKWDGEEELEIEE